MTSQDCDADHKLPSGQPCKNDSAMWDTYNTYSNGHGGCCSVWSGDGSPYGPMGNYFCGNSSAGTVVYAIRYITCEDTDRVTPIPPPLYRRVGTPTTVTSLTPCTEGSKYPQPCPLSISRGRTLRYGTNL